MQAFSIDVAVVGAGPAGLMAAEALAGRGYAVHVFDGMPSAGRKFLLAGKGGLNLTHGEDAARFATRYRCGAGGRTPGLQAALDAFPAQALRDWAAALGVETFVGSSGRVFPRDLKAAPLLRAWLHRLRGQGVQFHMRHRWQGWAADGALRFDTPQGPVVQRPRATVLALGGASWQRLGSDGAWWPWLRDAGVALAPLEPSNCGFDVAWSDKLRREHAGSPLKGVLLRCEGFEQRGEMVITAGGVEGSLVYAASAFLRDALARDGHATFTLDLLPDRDAAWVAREVVHPRGSRSLGSHLQSRLNLGAAKAALLWEVVMRHEPAARHDLAHLARLVKELPVRVTAARPIDEAISSAGGVAFEALDERFMLRARPGVFCAGEMLDWEAPTGGYLLTACFATGRAAGTGAADWLGQVRAG
ncbi:MAG: NAD(P)/FAD-dependent oxidoreductase [Betaproteobacteria bacterium]